MGKHMSARARRDEILTAALRLAETKGYTHVTRDEIAAVVGCSTGTITEMFGTMVCLRRALMRAAVANEVLPIVAQGLALKDPHAMRAPESVRRLAAGSIV